MIILEMKASVLLLLLLISTDSVLSQSVDLTLVPEANGTAVVQACISKLTTSNIFSNDNQMLRRIAFVETRDGNNANTYRDNYHGGIWQLSESKFQQTKSSDSQLLTSITNTFDISWSTVQWMDLRRPLYSAIAARLYFQLISVSIPLAVDLSGQASYWVDQYTSNNGSTTNFTTGVNELLALEDCSVSGLDLYFVLDESGSVTLANYQLMKEFAENIADSFTIGPEDVQIGLLSFSSSNVFRFRLNTYSSKAPLLQAIRDIPYATGGTNTAGALDAIRTEAFLESSGARPMNQGIPRVIIVVTDGRSNDMSATVSAAMLLHTTGIIAFAVGVSGALESELNAIATQPSYVSFITTFDSDQLANLQQTISIEACTASPEFGITDVITSEVNEGQKKYIQYEVPSGVVGITIRLSVSNNGTSVMFSSNVIQTPNEAVHDLQLTTSSWEDGFLNISLLSPQGRQDRMFLCIESIRGNSSVQISAEEGDTSTEPAMVNIDLLPSVTIMYGENLVVVCNITGKPSPQVTWTKDGTALAQSSRVSILTEGLDSNNYTLRSTLAVSVATGGDTGLYTCTGTNTLPNSNIITSSDSSTVTVMEINARNLTGRVLNSTSIGLDWELPDSVMDDIVDHYLVNVEEMQTSRNWTFCSIDSQTVVLFLHPYYTYSLRVAAVSGTTVHQFTDTITLTTPEAAPTFPPRNPSLSLLTSRSINVTWLPPPPEHQNGVIRHYLVNVTETETGMSTVHMSNTTWLFLNGLHPHYNYVLLFTAVTVDTGFIGSRISVQTLEDAPASAPVSFAGSSVNSTSVSISWQPPPTVDQNGVIRIYNIIVTEETGKVIEICSEDTSEVITALHPDYNYSISVAAFTIQNGPFSSQLILRTPEDSPSGSPQDLTGTSNTPFSIQLSWNPLLRNKQNGDIVEYTINVTNVETLVTVQYFSITTTTTIRNLQPFRIYRCTVAAVNSVNTGPFTLPVIIRTQESAPGSPPGYVSGVTVNSTTVLVTWDPPPVVLQNGVIDEYGINVTEANTGRRFQLTTNQTQITISDLHPYYSYFCSVTAITVGEGPYTDAVNVSTDEAAPSAPPQSVSESVQSSTGVFIQWSPPQTSDTNGIIRSYTVILVNTRTGTVASYSATNTNINITNLSPHTEYRYNVSATTVSAGPFSSSMTFTTPEAAPTSPPRNPSLSLLTSRSINVTWLPPPPEHQNGVIRHYLVNVTETETGMSTVHMSNTTWLFLNGLHPHYNYVLLFTAVTVDTGFIGSRLSVQTLEDAPASAPVSFAGSSVNSTSVSISWQPPPTVDQNGVIRIYNIIVTEETGKVIEICSEDTSEVITALHPDYNYSISVAAFTIQNGPFSSQLILRTPEDSPSGSPRDLTGTSNTPFSIQLSWNPLLRNKQNGDIVEYTINVTNVETLVTVQYFSITTTTTIRNLQPFRIYRCTVAAVNSVNTGPFTLPVIIRTQESAPGSPPGYVSGVTVNSTTILVTWDPPPVVLQNGVIDEYGINVTEANTGRRFQLTTNQTQITISDLHPYYSYFCSVTAITVGEGPYTDAVNVSTDEAAPSAPPQSVSESVQSSTGVFIQWSPPQASDTNGIIRSYTVILVNTRTGTVASYTATNTNINITNLSPHTEYRYNVSATTVSAGPFSSSMTFTTPEAAPTSPPRNPSLSLLTSRSINVTWLPPPPEHQNGVIRHYLVNVTETETGMSTVHMSNTTWLFLNGLHPHYNYVLLFTAVTVDTGFIGSRISVQTLEDAPASAPVSFAGSSVNSTSVSISWQPPPTVDQNGVIRIYNIIVTEETGKVIEICSEDTSEVITALHPDYNYSISVAAFTIQNGPFSSQLILRTPEDSPSGSPQDLTGTSNTPFSIQLSWNPLLRNKQNGDIVEYTINVTNVETLVTVQYFSITTTATIRNLQPFRIYRCTVAAVNSVNTGPFTLPVIIRTQESAPGSPPGYVSGVTVNSTTILVTWDPPPVVLQNGVIDEYGINVTEANTGRRFQLTTNQTQITIIDLHPYYSYFCSVTAITVGEGPYTDAVNVSTDEAAPSAPPQSVSESVQSSTGVFIQWSPPQTSDTNGIIRSYTIILVNTRTGTVASYSTTNTNINITNLSPYTEYRYNVSATTVSEGPFSSSMTFTTFEDIPSGPPLNVSASAINSTALLASWIPPYRNQQNGIIRQYRINLTESETGVVTYFTVQNILQTTLTDLHPYYNYQVTVAAITIGLGPYSTEATVQLPEAEPSGSPNDFDTEVVTNPTTNLTWSPPDDDELNGVVIGYRLICFTQGNHTVSIEVSGTSVVLADFLTNAHYTCTVCAFTSVGCGPNATDYFSTYENSLVGPPKSVTAANISTTRIDLQWEPPFDPEDLIDSYSITYQLINTSFPFSVPRPPVTITNIVGTSFTLQPLLESSVYRIVVTAVAGNTTSPGSDPIVVSTAEPESIDFVPVNLKCLPTTSSELSCTWEPPVLSDQMLLEYQLSYELIDGFDYYPEYDEVTETVLSANRQQAALKPLRPFGGYLVVLRANITQVDGSGSDVLPQAPPSSMVVQTSTVNTTLPKAPSDTVQDLSADIISPTSVQLSWLPPDRMEWGGIIDHYLINATALGPVTGDGDQERSPTRVVKVTPLTNNADPSLASEPLMLETYRLQELEEYYEYSITVSIVNAAGEGPSHPPIVRRMPETIPSGPPVKVNATAAATSGSLDVTWSPPSPLDANGPVTGYTLNMTRVKFEGATESQSLSGDTVEFTKEGLTAYEPVVVTIAARTEQGLGPFSNNMTFFTSEAPPSAPELVSTNLKNNTMLSVFWREPKSPNGVLLEYQIIFTTHSRNETTNSSGFVLSREVTETNLTLVSINPGIYDIKVRARNGAGFGENSSSEVVIVVDTPIDVGAISPGSSLGDNASIPLLVIGILLALVLLFIACCFCIICCRRRRRRRSKIVNLNMTDFPESAVVANKMSENNSAEENDYGDMPRFDLTFKEDDSMSLATTVNGDVD